MYKVEQGLDVVTTDDQSSAAKIMMFVKSNAKKISDCENKNIILVMGNTGAGKTTLVSLMTKVKLISEETVSNSGEFIISDEKHLISGISTTESQTVIPNLMVHARSGAIYFDCPGYNDTRGVANDISVSYFCRTLIEKSSSIKLVFVVSFSSVQNGSGHRHDFLNLVKHAITFIKDINKYADGIALIVTKVENRFIMKSGQIQLVDDKAIIDTIAVFLQQVISDLKHQNDEYLEKEEENNKMIEFIEIFLKRNNNCYDRIGIFRFPNQNGPIKDIEILQKERRCIKRIIHDHLSYVPKANGDFGYTVSDDTKNRIHNILEEMQSHLLNDVECIGNEIKQFYVKQEGSTIDLKLLINVMSTAYEKISEVRYDQINLFAENFLSVARNLNIKISNQNKKTFLDDIDLVQFLLLVSNANLSYSFHISNGLTDIKQYLDESHRWYNFLMTFHDKLCAYDVQNKLKYYEADKNNLMRQCDIQKNVYRNIESIGLKSLAENVGCQTYYTVENIRLNYFKLKTLHEILHRALDGTFETNRTKNKLVVKGYNVKIKDIDNISSEAIKYVEIFAINNLYIDADIDKTGQNAQITFIAPNWHVIGDRQIILNGEDGKSHSESHADGEEGTDGKPGNPGGASGNFFGFGHKSFNDEYLKMYLRGGNGGSGQDGRKDGFDSKTPTTPSWFMLNPWKEKCDLEHKKSSLFDAFIFGKNSYKVIEKKSKKPGNGGNGGVGGLGGSGGNILINGFKEYPNFIISRNKGSDGMHGKGGSGGIAGCKTAVEAEYIHILYFLEFSWNKNITKSDTNSRENGSNGRIGGNNKGIKHPDESESFHNISGIITDYKNYAEAKKKSTMHESYINDFIADLDVKLDDIKKQKSGRFSSFFLKLSHQHIFC
ncbi:uncharacterized protein LOC116341903 isoform X2 [Contarinia nasturtii]|uniref:uncharacterized protein LOC116341903 isoform X2 n=1 Tax=Contarinia nasturtii TaxID=265458 RepID=UPI0012D41968|nr:uncharacterized protein LOC116341903 isoform X2 [Contarinia nasturtii]